VCEEAVLGESAPPNRRRLGELHRGQGGRETARVQRKASVTDGGTGVLSTKRNMLDAGFREVRKGYATLKRGKRAAAIGFGGEFSSRQFDAVEGKCRNVIGAGFRRVRLRGT